ncbi:hypothetical protein RQP46_006214 [Phenoliferia psychrophenolica]
MDVIGALATPQIQLLRFRVKTRYPKIKSLLRIIRLENLKGLQQLEIEATPKETLGNLVGLALLRECEVRSISVLCRSGYVTFSELAAELTFAGWGSSGETGVSYVEKNWRTIK